MSPKTIGRMVVVTGAVAGGLVARRTRPRRADLRGWLAVTVNRAPSDVLPDGSLPAPLAELADAVEVQVRPAPGDKGTELAARWRRPPAAGPTARLHGDPVAAAAEGVARGEGDPQGRRGGVARRAGNHPSRSGGRLVAAADRVARGEGRL